MDPCSSSLFWKRLPSLQLGVTATADGQPFIIIVLSTLHPAHVTFATTAGYIPYGKKMGLPWRKADSMPKPIVEQEGKTEPSHSMDLNNY